MPRKIRRLTRKTLTAAEVEIYASYLKGERKHSQLRKAPAVYKERTAVAIVPFGLSPAETANFVKVSMTRGALGRVFLPRCILENRRSQALNAYEPRRLK